MIHFPTRLGAAALVVLAALPVAQAMACPVPKGITLSDADRSRMQQFDDARTRGLGEAMLGENAAERQAVSSLFSRQTEALSTIPDGKYRCRTIKLGGLLPLVTYAYFGCRIGDGGTVIEKTSGSQRFTGTLTPSRDALFYQGALHYNDDPPLAYGDKPDMDQVGCLYKLKDQDVYRLELPLPLYESTHDVIELLPAD